MGFGIRFLVDGRVLFAVGGVLGCFVRLKVGHFEGGLVGENIGMAVGCTIGFLVGVRCQQMSGYEF